MNPYIDDGGAGLTAAALMPKENWAARSAARQEQMQLGGYLASLKEQEVAQQQQAQAQAEAFLSAARSIPFMGRDLEKMRAHVKDEEKQLLTRLKDDYGGDYRKFWLAEGPQWQAAAGERLTRSPFYQTATQNRQNILAAQEARQKGEFIVGNRTPTGAGYVTGEQQLQDFLNGKADTFSFNGSYKPEDDLKVLREQPAPGKFPWERVAVDEDTKLNHLVDTYGTQTGLDKYYRQHQGTQVFYKTEPITKLYDFQREQGKYQMDVGRFGMEKVRLNREGQRLNMALQDQADNRVLKGQQVQLNNLRIVEKQNELTGKAADGKTPFDVDLLAHTSGIVPLRHDPTNVLKLPHSGVDLSQIKGLAEVTLFGRADEALDRELGLTARQKATNSDGEAFEHYGRGNITEAFTDQNGVHALDLTNSRFKVIGKESKFYYNPRDLSAKGTNPNGVRKYARVTVLFDDTKDAYNAGLYNNWSGFGETKAGTGVYNTGAKTATLFVPVGYADWRKGKPFLQQVQKVMGSGKNSGGPNLYFDTNFNEEMPYMVQPNL